MRNGIEGLSGLCRQKLQENPFSGALFIFRGRRKIALKILVYDGQGFWLHMKRLSQGSFKWWPSGDQAKHVISMYDLQILLGNGNPEMAQIGDSWRKVSQ